MKSYLSKLIAATALFICLYNVSNAQATKADVEQLFELSSMSMADIQRVYLDDGLKSDPKLTLSDSGIFIQTSVRVTYLPYRNIKSMFIEGKYFYLYLNQ